MTQEIIIYIIIAAAAAIAIRWAVRTVVECYKEAIQSYIDGTFSDEKVANWDERLKTVFNRGFWNGYDCI